LRARERRAFSAGDVDDEVQDSAIDTGAVRVVANGRMAEPGLSRQRLLSYNDRLVRDELIPSATFAAMNVMLAAGAKELESGPMIGFDSIGVRTERTAASDGRVLTQPTHS